jgi:hypothetical protein
MMPDLRYLAMVLVKVEDFTDKMRCRLVCTEVYEEDSSFCAWTVKKDVVKNPKRR